MTDPVQVRKSPQDDPLVISAVTFRSVVTIGGHGADGWSLENASRTQLHGRVRVEDTPKGLVFYYVAGPVYQRTTVPWSNISEVTEVPKSALKDTTKAFLEFAGKR